MPTRTTIGHAIESAALAEWESHLSRSPELSSVEPVALELARLTFLAGFALGFGRGVGAGEAVNALMKEKP